MKKWKLRRSGEENMWRQLRKFAQQYISIDDFISQGRYLELDEPIEAGDVFSRMEFGIRQGQDIQTYDMGKGVYGVWVSGDTDYWKDRLVKDYGADESEAKNIKIRAAAGDKMIEDFAYMTDPDTGIKADSAILLTTRPVLKYGIDWVFEDVNFFDERPVKTVENEQIKSIKVELQKLYDQMAYEKDENKLSELDEKIKVLEGNLRNMERGA